MGDRRRDGWDDEGGGLFGAIAIGGPVLGGLYGAARSMRDGTQGQDLGPAPIGSDPWLDREVRQAIAKEDGAGAVEVTVREAVVTLSGKVADADAAERIERAAKTVQGIAKLVNALES